MSCCTAGGSALMTNSLRYLGLAALCALWAAPLAAQTASTTSTTTSAQATSAQAATSPSSDESTRSATTTFFGDTGLWFVPTGEVLGHGKWSVSGYRRGTNYIQGFSNVGDIAGTFAVGIKDRAEIFGSFLVDTRVDRDLRPLFTGNTDVGRHYRSQPAGAPVLDRRQRRRPVLGAKFNLWSEFRQNPAALAVRGMVKVPTGDTDAGVSTGKTDFSVDFIGSKEASKRLEVPGYAGYEFRGQPDGFDTPSGAFRWGIGAGFPSRNPPCAGRSNCRLGAATTMSRRPPPAGGRRRRQSVAGELGHPEHHAGERRAHLAASLGLLPGRGLAWNVPMKDRATDFLTDDPGGTRATSTTGRSASATIRACASTCRRPRRRRRRRPAPRPRRAEPRRREGAVRSVPGGSGPELDGDRRCQRLDRRPVTYRWTAPSGTLASRRNGRRCGPRRSRKAACR